MLHPTASPNNLYDLLVAKGLQDVEPIYGMGMELNDVPEIARVPEGVEIRKVQDDDDTFAYAQFAAWRWNVPEEHRATYNAVFGEFRMGLPGTRAHAWQAWRDGEPIAKLGMYLGVRQCRHPRRIHKTRGRRSRPGENTDYYRIA